MTAEYFNDLKADFLNTYAPILCDESLEDIQNATDVAAFIAVLHKYLHFLDFKAVPAVEWIRKWFGNYQHIANENGVYFDQILALSNPQANSIVLYGKCYINAIMISPKMTFFTLHDESQLSLVTYGTAHVTARLKSEACQVNKLHCSAYSRIKIRRV